MRQKHRQEWISIFIVIAGNAVLAGPLYGQTNALSAPQAVLPRFIQQAQTLHLPINVFNHTGVAPVKDLKASDLILDVDGKPRSFQLSRPWDMTVNSKTGQPEDHPNLLIILPFDGPQYRNDAIDDAIASLKAKPNLDWNISILDDGGDQTHYTRDMTAVIGELKKIRSENPADTDLDSWRRTASLAIADMRDLPGRRVVMSLGDIFHEMVFDGDTLMYENYEAHDVAFAARSAGAVIYAADSFQEIGHLRGLFPYYYTLGFGPWMLLTRDDHLEGWISNFANDTISEIQQDRMAAYDIDLHLDPKQMDGRFHEVSIASRRRDAIVNAPTFYAAPSLAQLQELSKGSAALRQALQSPSSDAGSPLQLGTQVEYFPHRDGRTGTQIVSTGAFWASASPPPSQLEVALQVRQANTGFMVGTIVDGIGWSSPGPVWNVAMDVSPGDYQLRVAAAAPAGKISAGLTQEFTVAPPSPGETVRISSLAIGRSCVFSPPSAQTANHARTIDYLRAGNCTIQPEPSHSFSPNDVLWTLVRITPIGKLAHRPSKDWKGSFVLVDGKGSKLEEVPVGWLTEKDGSFVATAAIQLSDPKLNLTNGEYDAWFTLKGPGIERNYGEYAPFLVYGADNPVNK
ncbi:MAG: vWA domain-containing protein [Acidobacteriaceae bacterium]